MILEQKQEKEANEKQENERITEEQNKKRQDTIDRVKATMDKRDERYYELDRAVILSEVSVCVRQLNFTSVSRRLLFFQTMAQRQRDSLLKEEFAKKLHTRDVQEATARNEYLDQLAESSIKR